jgi:hypothetical protein
MVVWIGMRLSETAKVTLPITMKKYKDIEQLQELL